MKKLLPIIFLVGCASQAKYVEPEYVDSIIYLDRNCNSLTLDIENKKLEVSNLSREQNSMAASDAFWVVLTGIPNGQTKEPELGLAKGELESMIRTMELIDCENSQ